jgi:hypothetical protein
MSGCRKSPGAAAERVRRKAAKAPPVSPAPPMAPLPSVAHASPLSLDDDDDDDDDDDGDRECAPPTRAWRLSDPRTSWCAPVPLSAPLPVALPVVLPCPPARELGSVCVVRVQPPHVNSKSPGPCTPSYLNE